MNKQHAGTVKIEIETALINENARLRKRVAELEGELEYIRDLARTGLPPAGFSGENWAQHKLNRIAAKADKATAREASDGTK